MTSAVIVDAVRTPLGRRNGKLKDWHPVDLAAYALRTLVERNDLDPALVDDVIMGCVSQVGEQAINIGRDALLAAGFPESVPGTTVDRQCGSSQQAAHFAARWSGSRAAWRISRRTCTTATGPWSLGPPARSSSAAGARSRARGQSRIEVRTRRRRTRIHTNPKIPNVARPASHGVALGPALPFASTLTLARFTARGRPAVRAASAVWNQSGRHSQITVTGRMAAGVGTSKFESGT